MKRIAIAAIATAVLLLGACSDGDDDSGNKVPSAGTGSNTKESGSTKSGNQPASEDEILDYFACLRKNGVDIKDPTFDANGNIDFGSGGNPMRSVDRDKLDKAEEACGDFPQLPGGLGSGDSQEFQDNLVEVAKCMRQHGIDMP